MSVPDMHIYFLRRMRLLNIIILFVLSDLMRYNDNRAPYEWVFLLVYNSIIKSFLLWNTFCLIVTNEAWPVSFHVMYWCSSYHLSDNLECIYHCMLICILSSCSCRCVNYTCCYSRLHPLFLCFYCIGSRSFIPSLDYAHTFCIFLNFCRQIKLEK